MGMVYTRYDDVTLGLSLLRISLYGDYNSFAVYVCICVYIDTLLRKYINIQSNYKRMFSETSATASRPSRPTWACAGCARQTRV